jgi:hypothetical protein
MRYGTSFLAERNMKVASIPLAILTAIAVPWQSGTSSNQGTTVYRCWFCKYEYDDC